MNDLQTTEQTGEPVTPTADRFDLELGPKTTVEHYDWNIRVNGTTKLVPLDLCHAALSELVEALRPSDGERARKTAQRLFDGYPTTKTSLRSPFGAMVIAALIEYPTDIGRRAIANIIGRADFLPTIAEMRRELDDLRRHRKFRKEMVLAHIAEHARREGRSSSERARGTRREDLTADQVQRNADDLAAFAAMTGKPHEPAVKRGRHRLKAMSEILPDESREKLRVLNAERMAPGGMDQVGSGDDGAGDGQDDVAGS